MQYDNTFGLTLEQTVIMYSGQYLLTMEDIEEESDRINRDLKLSWLHKWQNNVETFLSAIGGGNDAKLIVQHESFRNECAKIQRQLTNYRTPLYLILLECVLFEPYYPFENEDDEFNKKTAKLKFNKDARRQGLETIATNLGIATSYIDIFESAYKSAHDHLTGFWNKVWIGTAVGTALTALTAGLALPYIAGTFAGVGLSGAAAISAGLAAIGGGAVAAGGLGMAGGLAVIVGGGAILGAGIGGTAGALMATSPEFTLTQAAKMEVVMKEIVLGAQKDVALAQEILAKQREAIQTLEKKLDQMKVKAQEDQSRIKNLEKSINYLKKALDQNIQYVMAA